MASGKPLPISIVLTQGTNQDRDKVPASSVHLYIALRPRNLRLFYRALFEIQTSRMISSLTVSQEQDQPTYKIPPMFCIPGIFLGQPYTHYYTANKICCWVSWWILELNRCTEIWSGRHWYSRNSYKRNSQNLIYLVLKVKACLEVMQRSPRLQTSEFCSKYGAKHKNTMNLLQNLEHLGYGFDFAF